MEDTKEVNRARQAVYDASKSGSRTKVVVNNVEAEDEVDRYKRTKGSSRETWPGEHDSNIKKLQGEENERRKKAGLPEKYPSSTPAPDMPKKK